MSFRKTAAVRNAGLDAEETLIGSAPKLRSYAEAQTASLADAEPATLLCEMVLPANWMADAAGGVKGLSGSWSGVVLPAALRGTLARSWRIYSSDGTTVRYDGSIGYVHGGAWALSTAYSVGDRRTNDAGKVYQCITAGTSASSGGPTGTGTDITDGGVHWTYIGASGDMSVDNPVLASGQTFSVSAFDMTAGNAG